MKHKTKDLLSPIIIHGDEIAFTYPGGRTDVPVPVRVNKRLTGHIQPTDGGYAYWPKGSTERGEVFPTFEECRQSVTGESK